MSFESNARVRFAALPPQLKRATVLRVGTLLTAHGETPTGKPLNDLARVIGSWDSAGLWLAAAVIRGALPLSSAVRRVRRVMELDGPWAAIDALLTLDGDSWRRGDPVPSVSIVGKDTVLLDVTGLLLDDEPQEGRGAGRKLAREWSQYSGVELVTWADDTRNLRAINAAEASIIGVNEPSIDSNEALVPHGSTYVLVGIVDRPRLSERIIALGAISGNTTGSVGYGLGPLIDSQAYKRPEGDRRFAWHLAAQRSLEQLAILGGHEIADHYRGWEIMLPALGLEGPQLHEFALPGDAPAVDSWSELARTVGSSIGIH